MGEPKGRKGVDEGYQRPATRPGLRRRRILRRVRQEETRKSATPKPALSVEGRVQVLEERPMDEIARLNLYYTQSAATFEYNGAVIQDLSMQLSWALSRIDVLEAAVMARPRADDNVCRNGRVQRHHGGRGAPEKFWRLRRISCWRGGDGVGRNGAAFADDAEAAA